MRHIYKSIGFALLAFVLSRLDWSAFTQFIRQLDTFSILLLLPLFTLPILAKIVRWRCLLSIQSIHLDYATTSIYFLASMFWGAVTPGRIGEMSRVFYLMHHGATAGRAAVSVILDRVLDLLALAGLVYIGLLHSPINRSLSVALGVSITAVGIAWANRSTLLSVFIRTASRIFHKFSNVNIDEFCTEFANDLKLITPAKTLLLIAYSACVWILYALAFIWAAHIIGLQLPVANLVFGVFVGTFIGFIPISIAGIGTRDVFFLWYFGSQGIPEELCIIFSFVFIYMYLYALGMGMIASVLAKRS